MLAMDRSVVERSPLESMSSLELSAVSEHGPEHARVLGGDRHASAVITAAISYGERPT
jgi:hypothetical protein